MTRPAKLVLCILIASCATPSFAQDLPLPKELSAAKSIAVLVRLLGATGVGLPSDFADSVRSRLVEEIQKHKRFEVVESPWDADLVCVYVVYGPEWVQRRKSGRVVISASNVIVLKGNASVRWDAGPLWIDNSVSDDWTTAVPMLMRYFHRYIEKGKGLQRRVRAPARSQDSQRINVFLACRYACDDVDSKAASRWNIVTDPSRAEFVVVWVAPSDLLSLRMPGYFVMFRGDGPDWNAMPLVAGMGLWFDQIFATLESEMARAVAYLVEGEDRADAVARQQNPPSPGRRSFSLRPATREAAGSVMKVWEESDRATKLFPAEPGMAVIYVAREHDTNRELIPITLDGEKLFDIEEGTYTKAIAAPGFHTVAASGGGSARNELNWYMEAGAVYFVMINGHTLTRVDEIDPNRILSVIP